MNKIELVDLKLKTFTEQDAEDYCVINNINPLDITRLDFQFNQLTDISGIKLFKNLEILYLLDNNITDISILKYLKNLRILNISDNKINDINILKDLKKLIKLTINNNKITDISVIKYLIELEGLYMANLRLKPDQVQYINKCKNLKELWCNKGFKDMSVLNNLNKDINITK